MKSRKFFILMILSLLIASLACNLPLPEETPDVPPSEEIPPVEDTTSPVEEPTETATTEPPSSSIVTYSSATFEVHTLDGTLLESRPAPGLANWARPNQSQVVGDNIYYVDSAGSSLGGMVKRVTPAGVEDLAFTSAPVLAALTFAVSPDGSKIAWGFAEWANSSLMVADINGANMVIAQQSSPDDAFDDFFVLETVQWIDNDNLIYSWQISGIGNLLYFGYSTLLKYTLSTATTQELVSLASGYSAPCWSAVSEDGTIALGTCDPGGSMSGMREHNLVSSAETVFPTLPGQQQTGAASFAPAAGRIAYCFGERNAADQIIGSVAVRMNSGEDPAILAAAPSGYFTGSLWANESILLLEGAQDSTQQVYQLTMAGALTPFVEGQLIGLMEP
ncbi:MAG: hypothetical protein JXA25_14550 [Anaerolineales bacterium]|nr:hypothetical protein [Anaerolineales bacterium]